MEEQNESGFFCEVCDCVVKDSLNYLDHVNGKRHLRNLGVQVKKFSDSTFEEVKEMLEMKKRERELGPEANQIKQDKKKRHKEVRQEEKEEDDDNDEDEEEDEMAILMGFSKFSSSKR